MHNKEGYCWTRAGYGTLLLACSLCGCGANGEIKNDDLHSLMQQPEGTLRLLQRAFSDEDWNLLERICTEEGFGSIRHAAKAGQIEMPGVIAQDDYLLLCAEYIKSRTPVTKKIQLSDESVAFDFDCRYDAFVCLLMICENGTWKVQEWWDPSGTSTRC